MKDLDKLIADRLIEAIGRDTVDRFEEDKDGNLKISLVSLECVAEKIADELLALIEQEKKEVARDTLGKITELFPTDKNFTTISMTTIKALAKEYGVEL